jgi:hypothetical protein
MRRLSLASALLAVLFAAAPAEAQTRTKPKKPVSTAPAPAPAAAARTYAPTSGATMDNQISVWGILGYYYSAGSGVGLGARYQKVVVPQGFLHLTNGVRDELGVEGGVDFLHYSWDFFGFSWTYNEFDLVAGVVWNFWLTPQIAVYPKVDLGYGFGSWSSDAPGADPGGSYGGVFIQGAAGAVYKLDRLMLRAELGTGSVRLGAAFSF